MTTTDHGGLVGAASKLLTTARDGAGAGVASVRGSSFADPLLWIVRFVLAAGFILIWKKAHANPDWTDAAVIMLLGSAALMGEYYMGGEMVRGWFERSITKMGAALAVYIAVLGYAGLQWTGTASEMEANKAGVIKAAFRTDSSNVDELAAAKKERARVEGRLSWMDTAVNGAPVGTPESAQAKIDAAKGNTRYWTMTNGCVETKGPQTRAFCEAYRSAIAEKALASEKITLSAELESAKGKVGRYERAVASKTVVGQDERSDLRFLVAYAGLTEQAAMDFSAAWKIIIISFLACVLGMMIKAREYRDAPRKPWPFWKVLKQISYRMRRAIWGGAATPPDVTNVNIHGIQYHQMLAGARA